MKGKKLVIIIVAAVVVVAAAVVAVVVYSTNPYTSYARAFDKTTSVGSLEFNTAMTATMGGETTTATGNMKLRDFSGPNVNFLNTMDIGDQTITQFCDGENIYQDNGGEQTAFAVGDQPQPAEKGEFSMEAFLQEFSGLLDASKLKDLQIADKLDSNIIQNIEKSGSNYNVTLAPQLVDELAASLINSSMEEGADNPTVSVNSFSYVAHEDANGYIDTITYKADMDVTIPASLSGEDRDITENVELDVALQVVNPGKPVNFDLPDTDGYTAA